MPTKPPPIPEFNVPVADVPSGHGPAGAGIMTAIWWDWFQRFLRWSEECCAEGGGEGGGAVSSVSGTPPVVVSGTALLLDEEPIAETMAAGNVTVSMPAATGSVNGHLTSADWTTFNGKANASHTHAQGSPRRPLPAIQRHRRRPPATPIRRLRRQLSYQEQLRRQARLMRQ
jgi:hypothetical protein